LTKQEFQQPQIANLPQVGMWPSLARQNEQTVGLREKDLRSFKVAARTRSRRKLLQRSVLISLILTGSRRLPLFP